MGFHRQGQPAALDRAGIAAVVTRFLAEEIATANAEADPFLIEPGCVNAGGHHFIGSCGDVVCVHCSKVAWS